MSRLRELLHVAHPRQCNAQLSPSRGIPHGVFTFAQPQPPGAAEGAAGALLEARWEEHRERCWLAFLDNASAILARPRRDQDSLLHRYEEEAARLYGVGTAADMAASLRSWIEARRVH